MSYNDGPLLVTDYLKEYVFCFVIRFFFRRRHLSCEASCGWLASVLPYGRYRIVPLSRLVLFFYPRVKLVLRAKNTDFSITTRGNLARPWEQKDRPIWEIDQIVSILEQSLRALASLHARPNPVIHRDIKPGNILVADPSSGPNDGESGPHIKLADFGLAIEGTHCRGESGTYVYMAPELYESGSYSSKIDIWSLGVVILQLLMNGNLPAPSQYMQGQEWCFDVMSTAFANCLVCRDRDESELRENEHSLKTLTWNFVRLFMLEDDPKHRLSAQDCLNHEMFRQMYLGSRRNEKGWVRQKEITLDENEQESTWLAVRKQFKKSPMPKVSLSEPTSEKPWRELPDYPRLISPSKTPSKKNDGPAPAKWDFGVPLALAMMNHHSIDWGDAPLPIGFGLVFEDQDKKTVGKLGGKAS